MAGFLFTNLKCYSFGFILIFGLWNGLPTSCCGSLLTIEATTMILQEPASAFIIMESKIFMTNLASKSGIRNL